MQEWIRWGAVILSFVCLALFAAGAAYQAYAREQEMLSEKYRADNVTHEAISQGRRAAACEERERALGVAIAGHEPDPRGAYVGEAPLVCRVNGREWPAVREGGGRACRVHLP